MEGFTRREQASEIASQIKASARGGMPLIEQLAADVGVEVVKRTISGAMAVPVLVVAVSVDGC